MVNGYAGFFPPLYDALQRLMNEEFPSYRSLCALHELGRADTVVVDRRWLSGNAAGLESPDVGRLLLPAYQDREVAIYRLRPGPGDCRAASTAESGPRPR